MISVPAAFEDKPNLFTVLWRGDSQLMQIKKNCIILVGMTRAGKSTTFYWMRNQLMKGVMGKFTTFYQIVIKGNADTTQLRNTMMSETLVPSVYHLDDETTLIDMPGYDFRGNYIGVMGVSYFLNCLFQQAENVKFVLVFDEPTLFDPSGNRIIKAIGRFVNMFNYYEMNSDIKKRLFSSLSVVVTCSMKPLKHIEILRYISENLKDSEFILQNKESIVEIIDSIIFSERVQPFLNARQNEAAPHCRFIERFNDQLNWTYFPLKINQNLFNKSLINIPFYRDYLWLSSAQMQELNTAIEKRINSYTNFSLILRAIMNKFLNNWNNFIEGFAHNQKVSIDTIFDISFIFQNEISSFLAENDKYNSKELIEGTINVNYNTNLVGGLKAMLNIYKIVDQVSDQFESFVENMKAYAQYFSQFVDCLKPFCRNAEDEMLLLRLKFVLRRGFLEFSRFYAIIPDYIKDFDQILKDNCNFYIFQKSKKQYMDNFIKLVNNKLLRLLLPTLPDIQDFEKLFNDYLSDFQYKQLEDELLYIETHISIEFAKADIFMAANQTIKAALTLISAFRALCSQRSIIERVAINEQTDQQELQRRFEAYFMRKLKLANKIITVLRSLDSAVKPQAKKYALLISQDIKDVQTSCKIFDELLKDSQDSLAKHIPILDDYVSYCIKWGKFDKANELLLQKLSLEEDNYDEYLKIVKKIENLQANKAELEKDYREKQLPSLKNERSKGLYLEQLFGDVEKYLQA